METTPEPPKPNDGTRVIWPDPVAAICKVTARLGRSAPPQLRELAELVETGYVRVVALNESIAPRSGDEIPLVTLSVTYRPAGGSMARQSSFL